MHRYTCGHRDAVGFDFIYSHTEVGVEVHVGGHHKRCHTLHGLQLADHSVEQAPVGACGGDHGYAS